MAQTDDAVLVRIGTAAGCEIRITDDEYVSPIHTVVLQDRATGRVWVQDNGSTNGTRILRAGTPRPARRYALALGGEQVTTPVELHPGDVLIVGRTQIPWTPR